MTLKGEPTEFPRMPGQQSDVMPGSPLAITAVFTELVRERFRVGNNLAWVWEENANPRATETNEPGTTTARKIQIEPMFNVNTEVRNYRPSIFVGKGDTVSGKVALNNFAGQQLRTGYKGFYALATIPIDIECISDQYGESAQLGDIVWFYLLAGREQILQTFGMHDLTNPTLGRTLPFEQDKTAWSTHVTFEVQTHQRWTTVPISPILRDVVLRYRQSGETNPDTYFLKQYVP